MVTIRTENIFPASREVLWKLLYLHGDEKEITSIHPVIVSSRRSNEEGEVVYNDLTFRRTVTFERKLRVRGKIWNSSWRYIQSPPDKFRVEVVAGEGPLGAGSHHESTYSSVPGGTRVSTNGEWFLQGLRLPKFLHGWIVKRELNRSDKEDYAYVRRAIL